MRPITDLESLVRHLSGRGSDGRVGATPHGVSTGDGAEILDEIRRRSRALFEDPDDADGVGTGPPRGVTHDTAAVADPGIGPRAVLVGSALLISGAALGFAADQAWRADRPVAVSPDPEVRRMLAEVRARLAAPAQVAPTATGDPAVADLGHRLDARLAALDARLDRLGRGDDRAATTAGADAPRPPVAPDPAVAAMAAELAAIRREQANGEAATARHVQEMRTILQQVNTEVRKVLARPEPSSEATVAPLLALALQALVHNLQHPSAQVRGEAVEQLARLGPTARTAIPALRDRFARESDPNVRAAIQTALSILGSP